LNTAISKKANEFITKYDCTSISYAKILDALHSQGFSVIEYSHFYNDEETETLLNSLHLLDFSKTVNAFTYVDSTLRIVFLLEGLSDDEKLILLAHEEGHIFLKHITNQHMIFGENIMQEDAANAFSYLIRKPSTYSSIKCLFNRKKPIFISITVVAILLLGLGITHAYRNAQSSYYITQSGTKYHTSDCKFISGHKYTKISKQEADRLGYEPCSNCIK